MTQPHRLIGRASRTARVASAALCIVAAAEAQTFSYVGSFSDDVGKPTGVALESFNGGTFLYVSDHDGGRVFRYNLADGSRVQIAHQGRAAGEFIWPDGIAIEPSTHDLYIADRQLHRLTRLTRDGAFLMKWGDTGTQTNRFGFPGAGSDPGQFNEPVGVALDANGYVYTTEHENHRVQKFRVTQSPTGWGVETIRTWGGGGSGPGQFNTPYGITVDSAGIVWVADGYNSRLQKFTADGGLLGQIVVRGATEPHVVVTWVTLDRDGGIYASVTSDPNPTYGGDPANQRIQKFRADGTSLGQWGSYGSGPGQFRLPFGIAIDAATHRAYVADYDNQRVQIFAIDATTAPSPDPPPAGTAGRLVNLSSRQSVAATDPNRVAIAGFVVGGTLPRQILVRAVGPSLAQFGVAGPLPNPRLQIRDRSGAMAAENDDWSAVEVAAPAERAGAFPLVAGSADAALMVTLAPGAYTAQAMPQSGSGVVLLEIYDVGAASSPAERLVNLSSRGVVDTAEAQLAAGFVVSGTAPKRVLVRAVGPGLSAFGVSAILADPVLRVFTSGSASPLAANDNWETQSMPAGQTTPTAADISNANRDAGAFALASGSRDAAMILTLPPGAYTAVVSGVNGATGAALVEVFELPAP